MAQTEPKMSRRELANIARQYREQATELSRWVHLNHASAATWRAEAAKFRDMAIAIEIRLASHGT